MLMPNVRSSMSTPSLARTTNLFVVNFLTSVGEPLIAELYTVLSLVTVWLSLRPRGSLPDNTVKVIGPTFELASIGISRVTRSTTVPRLPAGVIQDIVMGNYAIENAPRSKLIEPGLVNVPKSMFDAAVFICTMLVYAPLIGPKSKTCNI